WQTTGFIKRFTPNNSKVAKQETTEMKSTLTQFFFASLRLCVKFSLASKQRRKVFILLCLGLTACQSTPEKPGKRYDIKGTVVSVDKAHRQVTLSHEEVKGFMEAMTMPFTLKDAWPLDIVKPGDELQAVLVVTDDEHWLEQVVVVQGGGSKGSAANIESSNLPKPGDTVPDFRLINQDGKPLRFGKYRGKALLLTFIYTRCPVPEYCTLMSNNFAEIDRELQKEAELYKRTHLVSISFDPEYDTPKVLRSYGAAHTEKFDRETFEHWEFATGTEEEVKKIAQYFGLTYVPEKDEIVHSLQTALIAPDGKLFKLYSGNDWKPAEVLQDIRNLLAPKGAPSF
ncbi:MAG TPA: SCO family protein, partial [Blastocatellia bacterium]|nr:SCO family protein [Blastocatellia bacterium]